MECKTCLPARQGEENLKSCKCTYPCERRGLCCECVKHHREKNELPGCYFTEEAEKIYDRSIENFLNTRK